jgi:excisionase family DNA binding protein
MKDQKKPEKLMTLEEVAEYLRLSVHTIYKMAQKGKIPALKAGKKWRFRKGDIDRWLSTGITSFKRKQHDD